MGLGILFVLIVAVVAVVGVGGYVPLGSHAEPFVTLVSTNFGVYPQASGASYISGIFWVQNTGTKPIVSLSGSILGLPPMNLSIASYLSTTLYPDELGTLIMSYQRQGTATAFESGTNHTLVMNATFSDGSTATLATAFTSGECGTDGSLTLLTFNAGVYGVDSSSGQATWQLSAQTNTTLPVDSVVVGVNNGTLWFPLDIYGAPVSDSNPLRAGLIATQSLSWKNVPGSYQVTQWVGQCPDKNGMSTWKIFGN